MGCKQSLAIGRKTVYSTQSLVYGSQQRSLALAPRPDRVGVILSATQGSFVDTTGHISIGVMDGNTYIAIGAIDTYNRFMILRIDDVGQIILNALYLYADQAGPAIISLTDLYLTGDLKDL